MPVIPIPNGTVLADQAVRRRDIEAQAYSVFTYLSLYVWPRLENKKSLRDIRRMPPSHQEYSDLKEHRPLWPLKNINVSITFTSPRSNSIIDAKVLRRHFVSSSNIPDEQMYAVAGPPLTSSSHSGPHDPEPTNGYSIETKPAVQVLFLALLLSGILIAGLAVYNALLYDDNWNEPHPLRPTRRKLASRSEAARRQAREEEDAKLPWPPRQRRRQRELDHLMSNKFYAPVPTRCVLNRPKYMPSTYGACSMINGVELSPASSTKVSSTNGRSRSVSPANSRSITRSTRSASAKSMSDFMKWVCSTGDSDEERISEHEEKIFTVGGREHRCVTITIDLNPVTIACAPVGESSSRLAISERASEDSLADTDETLVEEQQRSLLRGSNRGRRVRASISEA